MPAAASPLTGTWRAWAGALICTLALNLLLFTGIPNLMKPGDTLPETGPAISQVQILRLRRPAPDPEPKKTEPKVRPEPQKAPDKPELNRPQNLTLALPFAVNPRLPAGPQTIALPQVMGNSLKGLNLTGLFDSSDLDQPLTVISRIPPIYPFRAKAKGIEGWVSVAFTVNTEGLVEEIKILEARPREIFDQSVVQCLSAWRFKPGQISGQKVRTRVTTRIRFELN